MIEDARARGVNVSTEVYPYRAGYTNLASVIFDEGWQERLQSVKLPSHNKVSPPDTQYNVNRAVNQDLS